MDPEDLMYSQALIDTLNLYLNKKVRYFGDFFKNVPEVDMQTLYSCIQHFEPKIKTDKTFSYVKKHCKKREDLTRDFMNFFEESINAISTQKWPPFPKLTDSFSRYNLRYSLSSCFIYYKQASVPQSK